MPPVIAVAALGHIKGLLDYNCLHADMSLMIYQGVIALLDSTVVLQPSDNHLFAIYRQNCAEDFT